MIRILILSLVAATAIQCASPCVPNPCNGGVCSEFQPKNPKQLPYATCACTAGKAGARCEQADKCVVENPCVEGKLCSLDNVFSPVCACPLGFHGKNCTERLCTIKLFPSKVLVGKTYIDADMFKTFEGLEALANKCNVTVQVTQSFTRSQKPEHAVPENETALYIGRGIAYALNDREGKKPASTVDANCFLKGVNDLNLVVNNNNILQDKAYAPKSKEYASLRKVAQVGCALNNDLPKVAVSKLVGKWELVERSNWKEYLAANDVGWFMSLILQVVKPDMILENDGKEWFLDFKSTFKSVSYNLTIGVESFEINPLNGYESKCLLKTEGRDKLSGNCTLYSSPPRSLSDTREIVGDKLVQIMKISDVVCKLIWKRKN